MLTPIKYLVSLIFLAYLLFPDTAYATGPGKVVAFFMIAGLILLLSNIIKFLSLKLLKLPIASLKFFYVVISEIIILTCFVQFPIILMFLLLDLIGVEVSSDSMELFPLFISFGMLAILPNLFLVKERNQKFREAISNPKKVMHAAILGFIAPLLAIFYMIIFVQ